MLDKLFSTLNEHEISDFCKEYAVSHSDFMDDKISKTVRQCSTN